MPDQVTFKELLQDPIYKAWVKRPPQIHPTTQRPWRVWVQRRDGGSWAFVDLPSYVKAYNRLIQELRDEGAWDGAVSCPSRRSGRPMVRLKGGTRKPWVVPEFHLWCPYCRRPTVWGYFETHHAMRSNGARLQAISNERRCRICGVRESFVKRYHRAF